MAIRPHDCKPGCFHGGQPISEAVSAYPSRVLTGVPHEVTEQTGLTSWPARGSVWASWFEMAWIVNDHVITIEYESQDGLWCVRHLFKTEVMFVDLFNSAGNAYQCARGRLDKLIGRLELCHPDSDEVSGWS